MSNIVNTQNSTATQCNLKSLTFPENKDQVKIRANQPDTCLIKIPFEITTLIVKELDVKSILNLKHTCSFFFNLLNHFNNSETLIPIFLKHMEYDRKLYQPIDLANFLSLSHFVFLGSDLGQHYFSSNTSLKLRLEPFLQEAMSLDYYKAALYVIDSKQNRIEVNQINIESEASTYLSILKRLLNALRSSPQNESYRSYGSKDIPNLGSKAANMKKQENSQTKNLGQAISQFKSTYQTQIDQSLRKESRTPEIQTIRSLIDKISATNFNDSVDKIDAEIKKIEKIFSKL